jgi:hypothetical protein
MGYKKIAVLIPGYKEDGDSWGVNLALQQDYPSICMMLLSSQILFKKETLNT